jgi:hypothetical protein
MSQSAKTIATMAPELRRSIGDLALRLRTSRLQERPAEPRFVDYDSIRLPDGELLGRKKVIIMSGGCSVPTCTMRVIQNSL